MVSDWQWRSRDWVAFTPTDADRFGQLLCDELPGLKFLSQDYWEPWVDEEETSRAIDMNNRFFGRGRHWYQIPLPVIRRPQPGESLRYFKTLGDVGEAYFTCWIEPEGWTPAWSREKSDTGKYLIENLPRLRFDYARGGYQKNGFFTYRRPEADSENDIISLEGARISIIYLKTDDEHRAMYRTVWRVLDALTTDAMASVDVETGKPCYPHISSPHHYAGYDACDWARSRARNFIDLDSKPISDFEERDFPPGLRDRYREVKTRWDERVAKRDRFLARLAKKREAQKKPAPGGGGQAKG